MNVGMIIGAVCMIVGVAIFVYAVISNSTQVKCTFDRNELGPLGEYGQWYYDVYKCADGTERRILVAGPRG